MGQPVIFIDGTEAQILSLESTDAQWKDKAFYYPTDKDYFYRITNGVMKKYGSCDEVVGGVGIKLNGKVIGGVKSYIENTDILDIPENYEYNVVNLQVDGVINCTGLINIIN